MPVLAVGVTVVSVLVGMIVGMGVPLSHALRAPHRQSEMAVRPVWGWLCTRLPCLWVLGSALAGTLEAMG